MSETIGRRARKKAETRALVRRTAQELFARHGFESVTIADVAAAADVAVQTVFNHFATKEELFFDGHTAWVEGPAEAVRTRPAGVPPLVALHEHLVERVGNYLRSMGAAQNRAFVATLEASPALRARERELHHESVARLADALHEAWREDGGAPTLPGDARTAASVTAAVWLAAIRTLLREQRSMVAAVAPEDAERGAALARAMSDQLLSGLGAAMSGPPSSPGGLLRTG